MGILQIFFLNTIELFAQYGLFKVALVHFAFTSESWVLTLLVRLSFSHFDSIWVGFGLVLGWFVSVCVGLDRFGSVWADLGQFGSVFGSVWRGFGLVCL